MLASGASAALKIALCSTNPAKVAACKAVCQRLCPMAVVESITMRGLPDQPLGKAETRQCAIARARHAMEQTSSDFGIGLEGGVDEDGWLINCAAVVRRDGRQSFSWGLSFELPREAARRILAQKEEMGPVMDELFKETGASKSHGGAIGQLTGGHVSRAVMWEQPLICAFIPFLNPALYPESTQ